MIRAIQEFFNTQIRSEQAQSPPSARALQLATAVLLIEISRADLEVADEEMQAIEEALRQSFGLTEKETREIVSLAEQESQESISIYEFTRLVDQHFDPAQKAHIVGLLWQVAYSDERLDEGEEYLVRKIAKLLHVEHKDFIDQKLKAKAKMKGG